MDIVPQAGMNFQRIFGRIHGEHVFRPGTLSFVVAGALPDLEGPVELFQQHDPGQVVGKVMGDMDSLTQDSPFRRSARP